jgi:hypothetical protein
MSNGTPYVKGDARKERYFIPLVTPYINPDVLKEILPHTNWIGFNLFEMQGCRKFYLTAKNKGIREVFGIDDSKKIFLSSTAEDEKLISFYDKKDGIQQFREDVIDFDVDMAMGPDYFAYEDKPLSERKACIEKAIDLNMKIVDLENVVPTIQGTNLKEIRTFVEPFKRIGKTQFIIPGRGRLINLGNKKKSQRDFYSLISAVVETERIELIVTGCNSPKQIENMPAVLAFAGKGWLIDARRRLLICDDKTYRYISDPRFLCKDSACCNSLSKDELSKTENESIRAKHNLRRISRSLTVRPRLRQYTLVR